MKKIIVVIFILGCSIGGFALGKCINLQHKKAKIIILKGKRIRTKKYVCSVKRDEMNNFLDGNCRNCGCHLSVHDNL